MSKTLLYRCPGPYKRHGHMMDIRHASPDELPGALDDGWRYSAKEAAEDTKGPQEPSRLDVFREAVEGLPKEEFNDDGTPDVRALNALLDDGVKPFSAAERDELWNELD